jgi:hemoglobin
VTTPFQAAGGAPGLLTLAHAWHARCLADPVVAHPFEHTDLHPEHTVRLAAYWGEALGGPPRYTDGMGTETEMVRKHAGNGEHRELDDRAIACFDDAMTDVGLSDDRLRTTLHEFFVWSTRRLAEHPDSPDSVPDGLPVPRWSWQGLQRDAGPRRPG